MTTKRPNILWIILDDSSHEMFGFSGGAWPTPNIDRIAREGVTCTRFHTASPICTPSRYSYLTGTYPGHSPSPSFTDRFPATAPYKLGFENQIDPGDTRNVAGGFRQAGYRTGMVGKYHVGPGRKSLGCHSYSPDEDPAHPDTARKLREDYTRLQEYFRSIGFDFADGISWSNTDDRPLRALQHHNLEWQTDHALRFLDGSSTSEKPFFLYFATTTQHGPHHGESLRADPRICEAGYLEKAPDVMPPRERVLERCREVPQPEHHLATGAVWTDDAVGALWQKLEETGQADNTVILFTTDHGPGTRSGKFTCYQSGAHIPFTIRAPGCLQNGTTCSALLQNIDVIPTLYAMCGLPEPEGLDGRNGLPQLRGEPDPREDLYMELGSYRAIRTSRWKYIALRYQPDELDAMKQGRVECAFRAVISRAGGDFPMHLYPHYFDADQLYDLETDPGEQKNLADDPACAGILADMKRRLRHHLETFSHPFPEKPDPFVNSSEFATLCERSRADRSIYEPCWYRNHGW